MDAPEFDRITRSWARPGHRRRLLRLLTAGVLGGWGWRLSVRPAIAQESPEALSCAQDADCADPDLDPCTGASCVDGFCAYFIVDCIPGHICCGNGACCPSGEPGACLTDADCAPMSGDPCEGARCEGGTCVPFLVACAPDFVCCGTGSCCPTNGCASDSDCVALVGGPAARTRCISGVCVPASTAA